MPRQSGETTGPQAIVLTFPLDRERGAADAREIGLGDLAHQAEFRVLSVVEDDVLLEVGLDDLAGVGAVHLRAPKNYVAKAFLAFPTVEFASGGGGELICGCVARRARRRRVL